MFIAQNLKRKISNGPDTTYDKHGSQLLLASGKVMFSQVSVILSGWGRQVRTLYLPIPAPYIPSYSPYLPSPLQMVQSGLHASYQNAFLFLTLLLQSLVHNIGNRRKQLFDRFDNFVLLCVVANLGKTRIGKDDHDRIIVPQQ